jgi:cytidine deaminase
VTPAAPVLRVALVGMPGAGKSTTAGLLRRALEELGRTVAVVKIAAPLYDIQSLFYQRMGVLLADGEQDGELLNFLGGHFRRSVPEFLLADFRERCGWAALGGADAIICDDARPVDLSGLAKQGFVIGRVAAPDALRRQRKAVRGDRRPGRDDHPTEAGAETAAPDFEVINAGGMAELAAGVAARAGALVAAAEPGGGGAAAGSGRTAVRALLDRAEALVARCYAENRHQIAAALLTGDGQVFTGLHVEAMVGRASVCAEAVALGKAREAGATDLRVVLALRHPKPAETGRGVRLVPPCGLCRELLLDYGPRLRAVVALGGEPGLVPLAELLPHKYVGTKWKVG